VKVDEEILEEMIEEIIFETTIVDERSTLTPSEVVDARFRIYLPPNASIPISKSTRTLGRR
jgi:hypothetical protein